MTSPHLPLLLLLYLLSILARPTPPAPKPHPLRLYSYVVLLPRPLLHIPNTNLTNIRPFDWVEACDDDDDNDDKVRGEKLR